MLKTKLDKFTGDMFMQMSPIQDSSNICVESNTCVLSAFSVLNPLAQLAMASVGKTRYEILTAIGFTNDNEIKKLFGDVNTRLKSIKGVEIKQACSIYIRDDYALNKEFNAATKAIFNSEVQNINFKQTNKAVGKINSWVQSQTKNHIKDLVHADSIDDSTVAILVNAIYFKGSWMNAFKKQFTEEDIFHITKCRSIIVPMMYQTSHFNYKESVELDCKFLQMPYKGGETSLIIVLPNRIDGVSCLVENLYRPEVLGNAFDNMFCHEVQVALPKFKIETTTDLKAILQTMNIKTLFNTEARLDNLLKQTNNVYISSAVQKAVIEVNEEGTEAAAANQATVVLGVALNPDLKTFEADHPFVFFLLEGRNILFTGVFQS